MQSSNFLSREWSAARPASFHRYGLLVANIRGPRDARAGTLFLRVMPPLIWRALYVATVSYIWPVVRCPSKAENEPSHHLHCSFVAPPAAAGDEDMKGVVCCSPGRFFSACGVAQPQWTLLPFTVPDVGFARTYCSPTQSLKDILGNVP